MMRLSPHGYTKSEPGAVATGSKRMRNCFVLSNSVVEHLGDDPVATAPGSDFV